MSGEDDLDADDAALAALAAAGGGEGDISARQDRSNLLVSTGPDVLWTPKGGGKEKVAYSVVAHMDTSIRLSTSVRNNGNYDFQLNSRTTEIQGHHPGTLKGVKVDGYQAYSHVKVASDFVYSEGFATVAHRHEAWINHPDPGPTEPQKPMQLAANTTTNFRHACRALGLDPNAASEALHDAKQAAGLGGADNCVFDLGTGDIFHNGEHIGNLGD